MTVATPASAAQITERPESVVFDGPPRDGNGVLPVCRRGQHRALEPDGQYFRTVKTSSQRTNANSGVVVAVGRY